MKYISRNSHQKGKGTASFPAPNLSDSLLVHRSICLLPHVSASLPSLCLSYFFLLNSSSSSLLPTTLHQLSNAGIHIHINFTLILWFATTEEKATCLLAEKLDYQYESLPSHNWQTETLTESRYLGEKNKKKTKMI